MDNIIIEPILNIVNVIKEEILIEYTIEVNPVYSGIQGIQGIQGVNGIDGIDGINGVDGIDGEDLTLSDFNAASEATVINQTDEFIIKQDNEFKRAVYSLVAPDASTTERGFTNTIAQSFAGDKTFNNLIWAKATPTDVVNTGYGAIGIGTDGSNPLFSFRLDTLGNLKLDKVYNSVFSNVFSVNREKGDVGINAMLSVVSNSATIGNAFDVKNSVGFPIATFKNNKTIEFGDPTDINFNQFFKVHGYMNATRYYVGASNTYFANDGAGIRVSGGYLMIEGTSNAGLLVGTKSTFGYINQVVTPADEILNIYGNLKIHGTAKGILMYTPDGLHQYKLSIDNSGQIISTLI